MAYGQKAPSCDPLIHFDFFLKSAHSHISHYWKLDNLHFGVQRHANVNRWNPLENQSR